MASLDKARWQRLSPLLDELLDTDGAQRAARLSQLRAEDQALADEVAALLAHEAAVETGRFLEGSPLDPLGTALLAGRTVGSYTLEQPIGYGGMGTVWLARRSDGRYEGLAAVKFLNLALLGRGGAERFQREGRALARLAHPNITRLLDAGVAGEQPYLVLEHVVGQPIDAWCDAQALDVPRRLRLVLQVLAAVSHAHRRLILHRDLKPPNILVTPEGEVKLLDFGIAKLLHDDESSAAASTEVTALGHAFTPDYAAPEQLEQREVTTATDVYALGVLLHVLLTGTHPTAGSADAGVDRMRALLEREPTLPSEAAAHAGPAPAVARAASPAQLARALRGDLDNIVIKALKKAPAERYPTVDALAGDVLRHLNHEPVTARGHALAYRAGRFVRRHRLAVGAASVTALALVAGIAGTTWQAIEARRQREEANAYAQRTETSRRLLKLMITEVGDPTKPVTPLQLLDRGLAMLDAQHRQDQRPVARLMLELADHYLEMEHLPKARELLLRVVEMSRAQGDAALEADAHCDLATLELVSNAKEPAQQRLAQAQRLLARIAKPPPLLLVSCGRVEANLLAAGGHTRQAIDKAQRAIELLRASGMDDHPMHSAVLTQLSAFYHDLQEFVAAYETNRRAGEQMDRDGRGGTMGRIVVFNNEAVDLANFGEFAQAAQVLAEVLKRLDARGDATARWNIEANYGSALTQVGRLDEALAVLDRAVDGARSRQNVPSELRARYFRARALLRAGRLDESSAELDRVESGYRRDPVQYRAFLRNVALTRAEGHLRSNRLPDAQQAIGSLLRDLEQPGPTQGPRTAALALAAEIALAANDTAAASQLATRAVARAEKEARDPARSAEVGRLRLILGKVRLAQGDRDGARATIDTAIPALAGGLGPDHALTREARQLIATGGTR